MMSLLSPSRGVAISCHMTAPGAIVVFGKVMNDKPEIRPQPAACLWPAHVCTAQGSGGAPGGQPRVERRNSFQCPRRSTTARGWKSTTIYAVMFREVHFPVEERLSA